MKPSDIPVTEDPGHAVIHASQHITLAAHVVLGGFEVCTSLVGGFNPFEKY